LANNRYKHLGLANNVLYKVGGEMRMSVNPKLKDALTDQLFQAILLLQTKEECYQFFEDICTIGELKSLAQRLEVARMLHHGHIYDDIVERTGASTATISRVKRSLHYGADGYKLVLARLDGDPISDMDERNGV
jgi:TrpR-related protein YerC/YecD